MPQGFLRDTIEVVISYGKMGKFERNYVYSGHIFVNFSCDSSFNGGLTWWFGDWSGFYMGAPFRFDG